MIVAAWKKYAQIGILAASLLVLPVIAPIEAQPQTLPPTETERVEVQNENDFPWGLLGLLGLIGLAGMKRRPHDVDRRRVDEPVRRTL